MQNLHLLEFLAEAFWCLVHHYQCFTFPVELAVLVLLLKMQVSEILHNEVNLIIYIYIYIFFSVAYSSQGSHTGQLDFCN